MMIYSPVWNKCPSTPQPFFKKNIAPISRLLTLIYFYGLSPPFLLISTPLFIPESREHFVKGPITCPLHTFFVYNSFLWFKPRTFLLRSRLYLFITHCFGVSTPSSSNEIHLVVLLILFHIKLINFEISRLFCSMFRFWKYCFPIIRVPI